MNILQNVAIRAWQSKSFFYHACSQGTTNFHDAKGDEKYDNVINMAFRMVGIAVASILLASNHYQITATYLNIAYQ